MSIKSSILVSQIVLLISTKRWNLLNVNFSSFVILHQLFVRLLWIWWQRFSHIEVIIIVVYCKKKKTISIKFGQCSAAWWRVCWSPTPFWFARRPLRRLSRLRRPFIRRSCLLKEILLSRISKDCLWKKRCPPMMENPGPDPWVRPLS